MEGQSAIGENANQKMEMMLKDYREVEDECVKLRAEVDDLKRQMAKQYEDAQHRIALLTKKLQAFERLNVAADDGEVKNDVQSLISTGNQGIMSQINSLTSHLIDSLVKVSGKVEEAVVDSVDAVMHTIHDLADDVEKAVQPSVETVEELFSAEEAQTDAQPLQLQIDSLKEDSIMNGSSDNKAGDANADDGLELPKLKENNDAKSKLGIQTAPKWDETQSSNEWSSVLDILNKW